MQSLKNSPNNCHRLLFFDGLRGVAISLVVLHHAYARWVDIVPFGHEFEQIPLFAYGWVGVQLFFLVSGFVIFMTLEKSANFVDFMFRRWLRLFPAMLTCSILLFITAGLFPERPAGLPTVRDLLPGLTFIEPRWWSIILGSPQGVIDGVFWTLFVEVKFYILVGLIYFMVGWRVAIVTLVSLFMLSILAMLVDFHVLRSFVDLVSARHYGWFAAGALYYRYFTDRNEIWSRVVD